MLETIQKNLESILGNKTQTSSFQLTFMLLLIKVNTVLEKEFAKKFWLKYLALVVVK